MYVPKNNLSAAQFSLTLTTSLILSAAFLFACGGGDDPISLGSRVPETGGRIAGTEMPGAETAGAQEAGEEMAGIAMAGDAMAGDAMAGVEMAGAETMMICGTNIDKPRFGAEVGPALITTCATAYCHGPDGQTPFNLPVGSLEFSPPLEGQLLEDALNATMSNDRYIIPGDPQASLMLRKASNGHGGIGSFLPMTPEYDTLSSWIKDMYSCREDERPQMAGEMAGGMAGEEPGGMISGETDPGPSGGSGDPSVLCDLLPNGDPQNRADGQYYEVFVNEANEILTRSCGSGGCHGTPMNGFWLRAANETCAIESNFLMTQAYINFANPNRSPILEAAYDPYHSGYTIFTGRTDPRFITLQSWILLGFED